MKTQILNALRKIAIGLSIIATGAFIFYLILTNISYSILIFIGLVVAIVLLGWSYQLGEKVLKLFEDNHE